MITASNDLKNIFYNSRTVNISAGATIEYNMNSLLDNITLSTTITDNDYISDITPAPGQEIRINPYKKLFPIDSIVKPFRPINSGIKNYILLDSDNQNSNIFYDYRTIPYPSNSPRVYYAGTTNYYKYWVTPQNTGVNVTVKYVHDSVAIESAYSTGPNNIAYPNKVVYKTSVPHGLIVGQIVSMSGGTALNLSNQTITSIISEKEFSVTNSAAATTSTGGTAQLRKKVSESPLTYSNTSTKPALANKIVIAFEKYHALPATCSLVITYSDNTTATVNGATVPSSTGRVIFYYNGSTWSTTPPFSSSQPISYAAPREIKSILLTTPTSANGPLIAVTEISARWIKDISSDLVSFNIEKESTSDVSDLLPVGNISANSLAMDLVKYNQSSLRVLTYNREDDWTLNPAPNDVIYFAKNAEIKPHFKVYHSAGAITEGSLKYDIVEQGTFYLDSHSISEYGNVQINGLDGSKHLMETLIPDLIYENAPVTSIIMSILDSIGFSNYNINISLNGPNTSIDTSIPTLTYWWSENNKTVWDCLQELCRDVQMNALFDENNVFQFYTRDYLYNKATIDWAFTYNQDGNTLPNISSFEKKEIASANQVKIIWRTPMSSLYNQNATDLWSSEPSFLIAGGLRNQILSSTPAELVDFDLDIEGLDSSSEVAFTFGYSGYFLVNSEVFEYDAIQYQYEPLNSTTTQYAFVSSEADWAKYRALSKTGFQYFKPTGKYRIKARALFGTTAATHAATGGTIDGWNLITADEWS